MNHFTNVILAQADSFQADIFPPAPSNEPSVSASEYFNGKNPTLKLISLENGSPAAAPPPSSSSYSAAPPTPSSAAPAPPPIQATRSYSASAPAPAAAPPPAAASFSEPIPTPTSAVPRSAAVSSPVETRTPIRSQTSDSKVCLRNESSFNIVLIFFCASSKRNWNLRTLVWRASSGKLERKSEIWSCKSRPSVPTQGRHRLC